MSGETSKLALALLLSAMMIIASMAPAFAAVDPADVSKAGSITISSPIMGAQYTGYQIFEMTKSSSGDAYSYTINKDSKFYNAVKDYADVAANGLTLTAISSDPNTFSVSVDETKFNAQTFGAALELALKGKEATDTEPAVAPTITGAKEYKPTYEDGATAVTVKTSEAITFEKLPLGYYLILSKYPDTASKATVKLGADTPNEQVIEVTKDMTDADMAALIKEKVEAYVNATVTDANVDAYITANPNKGNGINGAYTAEDRALILQQLKDSAILDGTNKAVAAINDALLGPVSDDNTLTQRLVFIDSTTPHADIIEKNEEHKWDVPVNPEGTADLKPHGEPHGGKNLVIEEGTVENGVYTKMPVYADWTESNVGDDVHYQLSVNAVNFERTSTNPITVKQIKEYILADYENKNMTFVPGKKLTVTIVKKQADGTVVEIAEPVDYTAWADKFFHNDNKTDLGTGAVLTTETSGLAIPWVKEITKVNDADLFNDDGTVKDMTNVTTTQEPTQELAYMEGTELTPRQAAAHWSIGTGENEGFILDEKGQKVPLFEADGVTQAHKTITHYWKSLYPNDVTILVDYWMTLNDTATVDGDGNINYAQYGVNFIEKDIYEYTGPDPKVPDDRKPSELKEKDDAKVYTYALAIHKVDEDGRDLDGAKFKIKGLTVTRIADGWYKVKKYYSKDVDGTPEVENSFDAADQLVTDAKGFLVIEGLMTSEEVEIQETQAPDGYNKLENTVKTTPKKIGATVTTSSKITYKDEDGVVTGYEETKTVTQYTETKDGTVVIKSIKTTKYGPDGTTVVETVEGDADPNEIAQTQLKPVEFKVENKKGVELPSTGGIGTTIFYVAGSILVLAAAILLITKRRMGAND